MPTYNVDLPAAAAGWNVAAGMPGLPGMPGARPRATLNPAPGSVVVPPPIGVPITFNNQALAVGAVEGLQTSHLANCSAFAIFWRPAGAVNFTRASLAHISGGPNAAAVPWGNMLAGMAPGGQFFGILANSTATVLTPAFIAAVTLNTPIPGANLWVYDANSPMGVINFAIDRSGNAGQF